MKTVTVHLRYRINKKQEQLVIKECRDIGGKFYGDDDLRDAIHELVGCVLDANDMLFMVSNSMETEKSVTVSSKHRRIK